MAKRADIAAVELAGEAALRLHEEWALTVRRKFRRMMMPSRCTSYDSSFMEQLRANCTLQPAKVRKTDIGASAYFH